MDATRARPLSKNSGSERPEVVAAKLNRSVHASKARGYMIGLPLKWFKLKMKRKTTSPTPSPDSTSDAPIPPAARELPKPCQDKARISDRLRAVFVCRIAPPLRINPRSFGAAIRLQLFHTTVAPGSTPSQPIGRFACFGALMRGRQVTAA
jgi:hypothetical protein